MRGARAIAFLVLSAPFWGLWLVVFPAWLVERLCYRVCRRALFGFLGWMRYRNAVPRPAPGTAADLLAKQRRLRRHVNYRKSVRS
jgi:hypothetical protein